MPHVLAYTSPARGHLFPITPTIDELERRGHRVSLRTLNSQVDAMRERGFDAEPIDPAIEAIQHDDYRARTSLGGLKRAMATFGRRAPVDARDLQDAISEVDPDALLVDVNAFGASAVAEAWGGPWASWCPWPLPLPSRGAPPAGPGFAPAKGPLGRVRDRIAATLIGRSYDRSVLPALNDLRGTLRLEPLHHAVEALVRAPLVFYMSSEPFEYPRPDWPPNVMMVGPGDWDSPAAAPAWLAEIEAPIVLVSTSSEFQNDHKLVDAALEALAGEDLHVVATIPAGDPADFDPPANSTVVEFAPHGPILEHAACAVTHAGMGATQKALAHGVPVCAVPFGRDQPEVARRVEQAGAGTMLPATRLEPARLRAKVHQTIACREGAARVAAGYRATGEAQAAADAFEALL
jgi:UDP:flavonoid glycosyltransferase YjiC (YdhE family)